jgi:hypothetical protein
MMNGGVQIGKKRLLDRVCRLDGSHQAGELPPARRARRAKSETW